MHKEIKLLSFDDIIEAGKRIASNVVNTPIITSDFLNEKLKSQIFFKLETHQRTGSFKARGALNHLLYLKETKALPKKVVAYSSGNHAQAVAYACKMLDIEALICTSKVTSPLKISATRRLGAEVIITEKRSEAEALTMDKVAEGYHFIHPSNDDLVIAGQGTACLEALDSLGEFNAIFAPCGGGGLISGTYLAAQNLRNKPKIYAAEPLTANDAALSLQNNEIYHFADSPNTIADGARTLAISPRTFAYLKLIDGIIQVSENDIIYWTQWLHHILKTTIEPTSAMAMAACFSWIKDNPIANQKILVILSGGNIGTESYQQIWKEDFLINSEPQI